MSDALNGQDGGIGGGPSVSFINNGNGKVSSIYPLGEAAPLVVAVQKAFPPRPNLCHSFTGKGR